jgi:hypothetical protein
MWCQEEEEVDDRHHFVIAIKIWKEQNEKQRNFF